MRLLIYREVHVQKINLLTLAYIFILLCITIPSAHAVTFKIEPSLLLEGTYKYNEKRPSVPASQEFISRVSPAISISETSARTNSSLDYALHKKTNFSQNIDNLDHEAHAIGNLALIKNYVNISAIGNYEQRPDSVDQILLIDDSIQLQDTANFASAYIKGEILNHSKQFFDANMKYTHNISKSDSKIFSNTSSHKLVSSIKEGKNFHRFGWGADASYEELKEANRNLKKIAEVTGNISYLAQRQSGIRLTFGYESNPQYQQINPNVKRKGRIALVSAFWRSPKNLNAEIMAGNRAFGKTYQIKSNWQTPLTTLSASYGKSINGNNLAISIQQDIRQATLRFQYNETLSEYSYVNFIQSSPEESISDNLSSSPPPLLPTVQPGTFYVRRASSGITLHGTKNTLTFNADYETKDYTEIGTDAKIYNAEAIWQRNLNALANTYLKVSAINANDNTLGAAGLYTSIKLEYEHQIKKYFLFSITAQRWQHKINTVNLLNFKVKSSY